ncbi:MAG: histidine phosphatase family protein, partial [Chloroflexota bacterium]|nr:histidine phosphatase family protein [Chloroflexota bacterium]
MRLILVRHGQTDWNKEYRVQGHRDLSLNEFGMAQAEAISKALQSETVEAIYSSPLLRAYQVAQAINQTHQVDITSVSKLKELDVGETDGLHYPELGTLYPDFFKLWTDDAAAAQFPGGESLPELQGRVWEAVENIIAANHLKSVVITSHFFALLTLLCKVLDLGLSDFRRLNLSVASI